jgi:D-galactarolactone isomerase
MRPRYPRRALRAWLARTDRRGEVGRRAARVLDHFGGLGPDHDESHPAWSAMRALLDGGNCWVKISGLYRKSQVPETFDDYDPQIERFARCTPDRLLWGSDWPHTWFFQTGQGAAPQYSETLAPLVRVLGRNSLLEKVLAAHPEQLYR